ncbi:MAG: hypothetical protein RR816_07580 [Clostridia bacterium]
MPFVNYCRKCKTETPLGESCPYCGGKLPKTGEQISFGIVRKPVQNWFAWNQILRVVIPVLLLVLVIVVTAEAVAGGTAGVVRLFSQGFFWTLLGIFGAVLLLCLLLLCLQGTERVHYVLDKQGVHACTYVRSATDMALFARFLTLNSVQKLNEEIHQPLEGLTLIRRISLPWAEVRRVRVWREGFTLLFFRPSLWQVLAVCCPMAELEGAEAFVRNKLKRNPKVKVQPIQTKAKT